MEPVPRAQPVSVVATSAYTSPEFVISVIGILVLIVNAPEVNVLIPAAYQPLVLKIALAVTTITNIVGGQLRNRPTLLSLAPGQTQRVLMDPIEITSTEAKDTRASAPTIEKK